MSSNAWMKISERKHRSMPEEIVPIQQAYIAGAIEMASQGWVDVCERMPEETKQTSDTMQGHREWTESKLVLAWDSMYGPLVDSTRNGK